MSVGTARPASLAVFDRRPARCRSPRRTASIVCERLCQSIIRRGLASWRPHGRPRASHHRRVLHENDVGFRRPHEHGKEPGGLTRRAQRRQPDEAGPAARCTRFEQSIGQSMRVDARLAGQGRMQRCTFEPDQIDLDVIDGERERVIYTFADSAPDRRAQPLLFACRYISPSSWPGRSLASCLHPLSAPRPPRSGL